MSVVDASTLCNRAPGESRTPPGMPAGVDPTRSSETAAAAAAGAAPVAKGMDEAAKGKPAAAGGAAGGGANLLEMLSRAAGSVDGSEEEKEKEVNEPAAQVAAPPAGWNGPPSLGPMNGVNPHLTIPGTAPAAGPQCVVRRCSMVLTFWCCVAGVGPYLPPATKSDPGYPPTEPQTQGTKRPRPEELHYPPMVFAGVLRLDCVAIGACCGKVER